MMRITTRVLKTTGISLLLSIGVAACGGADDYRNDNNDDDNEEPIATEVSLDTIQADVFTPTCSGCHSVGGAAEGTGVLLDSTTNSFNTLVSQNSSQATSEIRVIPGDAENSYLVKKLEGTASVGGIMPPGGSLSEALISNVKTWINALPVEEVEEEVTLATIQTDVFTPTCSGCHSVGGAAEGTGVLLDSTTNSFNTLVNQTSAQASPEVHVIPADAENSYLIKKLEGTASAGGVMPPNGSLSAALIGDVRAWIDDGALQDDSVTTSAKIFGAELNGSSQALSFSVQLSGVLDADTSIENMVLVYEVVDGVSTLSQASDVKTVYSGSTITITYLGDENVDQLDVQINNPDVISILDSQGRLLDGNGDGEPGGMFVFTYPDDVALSH